MTNRKHITVENSEYRRVLDRCNSAMIEFFNEFKKNIILKGYFNKNCKVTKMNNNHWDLMDDVEKGNKNKLKFAENERSLKNAICQIKNDFIPKISNTCPEYSVLLATKIIFNEEDYHRILESLRQNQRDIDEQLDILGARQMAGILGEMPNQENLDVWYTVETSGLPKSNRSYSLLSIQQDKEKINKENMKKLQATLPKNNLYLTRSGGSGAGHYFCIYVSSDNFFKIDVMGGDDLSCQPLYIKSGKINDNFAEKFRFTGITYFYKMNNIEDIDFFERVITDKEYRNEFLYS